MVSRFEQPNPSNCSNHLRRRAISFGLPNEIERSITTPSASDPGKRLARSLAKYAGFKQRFHLAAAPGSGSYPYICVPPTQVSAVVPIVAVNSSEMSVEKKRRMVRYACHMGSERSSTVRQIRSGQICALCRSSLPAPWTRGEQLCAKCRSERKRHRVYMSFMVRKGWVCQFLEEDLKTPLPRRVTLGSDERVREMARRGGAAMSLMCSRRLTTGLRSAEVEYGSSSQTSSIGRF